MAGNRETSGMEGRDNTMNILNQQLTDVAVENQYLAFRIGDELYAVEVLLVQEIIRYVRPTKVPNSTPVVRGVINFRGKVIPVIDMRRKFGLPEREYDSFTVIIVLEVNNKTMGMIVDSVTDVISFSDEDVQEGGDDFTLDMRAYHIKGMGRFQDQLVQILDPSRVLSLEEMSAAQEAGKESARGGEENGDGA